MRRCALALAALGLVVPARLARADSGALFGESSRTAGLADAVSARGGELSAIYYNPGGLADLPEPTVELGGHVGSAELYFARHGEPEEDMSRLIAGYGLALGSPLPGPAWLRAFRLGLALHVPAQHALEVTAPARLDQPSFPLYGDRAERLAIAASVAVQLFDRIGIGAGFSISPRLNTPTLVSYQAGRGDSPDDNVVVDLERELELGVAALFGIRAEATDWLALGFAFREKNTTAAAGPNDVRAGALVVTDRIDFYDFLEPDELVWGLSFTPHPWLGASVDLVHARWSAYRTIHNQEPYPHFDDVVNLRLGLESLPVPPLALRLGFAYEPTPVPPQRGDTNLLDGTRFVLAGGAGWDLRAMGWAPLRLDVHGRGHLLVEQEADKELAEIGDGDPEAPGKQIDNLGYPGFRAGGAIWDVGLSVTFFLGGGAPEPTEALEPEGEP